MCLSISSASMLKWMSTETTNQQKLWCFWSQASRYLHFISFSSVRRHFLVDLLCCEKASVFTTHMLWILSIPLYQRSYIRRCTFWLDVLSAAGVFLRRCPIGWSFPSWTAQPVWMKGSSLTCEGVKSLPARSATPSRSSLVQVMTRSPFLKYNVWHRDNSSLHPSQWGGESRGSMTYCRKR